MNISIWFQIEFNDFLLHVNNNFFPKKIRHIEIIWSGVINLIIFFSYSWFKDNRRMFMSTLFFCILYMLWAGQRKANTESVHSDISNSKLKESWKVNETIHKEIAWIALLPQAIGALILSTWVHFVTVSHTERAQIFSYNAVVFRGFVGFCQYWCYTVCRH